MKMAPAQYSINIFLKGKTYYGHYNSNDCHSESSRM